MIEKIQITNFKSHKDSSVSLKNLTVLCGQNGTGKSSLIQSLLLLRQTDGKGRLNDILDLNDPLCFLGKTKDVLYQFSEKSQGNKISFVLIDSAVEYTWVFDPFDYNLSFLKRHNAITGSEGFQKLSLFKENFQYISAARNSDYKYDDYAVQILKQLSKEKGKGELTAQFLYQHQKKIRVLDALKHEMGIDDFLLSQTSAWEKEISEGVNIIPVMTGESSYAIQYSFETEMGPTENFTTDNVGFGLSYSLPIIVSILAASPNSLLLIENPEAHIHPYGQSKIAELICLAAQAGIQLIVETHSDHILNGILVQCKKFEEGWKGIDKDHVKIYHFERNDIEHATIPVEIEIEEGGRIKNRRIGFFDQIGKDLRKLI
jgi:predicted ATP-dependent endonuclease of OLD family